LDVPTLILDTKPCEELALGVASLPRYKIPDYRPHWLATPDGASPLSPIVETVKNLVTARSVPALVSSCPSVSVV
jgi:hypothetical protein